MSVFAIPALALVGFELAFATHTIGAPAAAGLLAVWLFEVEVRRSGSLALGIALGLLCAWAFRFVPLLRWELWRSAWRYLPRDATNALVDDPSGATRVVVFVHDGRTTLYTLAVGLVWTGAVLTAHTEQLLLGVLLVLIGASTALYFAFLWFTSDSPSAWLTLTSVLVLTALLATTLINTGSTPDSVLRHLALQAALFFLAALGAAFHVRLVWTLNAAQRQLFSGDIRAAPSQTSIWSVALRWLLVWFVPALIYGATAVALALGGEDAVLPTVFFSTVVLCLLAGVVGVYYWWRVEAYAHYRLASQNDFDVSTQAPREPDEELGARQFSLSAASAAPVQRRPLHQLARHIATPIHHQAPPAAAVAPSALSAMAVKKN